MGSKKESILFELSKNGQQIGHILGTMHIKNNRAFTYLPNIKDVLCNADLYLGETNLDELKNHVLVDQSSSDRVTLDQIYSKKKFNKMRKICIKSFGIDLYRLKQMSPISVISLLTFSVLSEDQPLILDQTLWSYAQQQNIPVKGIESAVEQNIIYEKIPLNWQEKQLKDILSNVSKFRKSVIKIADSYEEMEVNKLYKYSTKQLGGVKNLLLYDRNKLMADRIEKYSEAYSNIFISVGLGHLPGKKGILRLLKKREIHYKPIPFIK